MARALLPAHRPAGQLRRRNPDHLVWALLAVVVTGLCLAGWELSAGGADALAAEPRVGPGRRLLKDFSAAAKARCAFLAAGAPSGVPRRRGAARERRTRARRRRATASNNRGPSSGPASSCWAAAPRPRGAPGQPRSRAAARSFAAAAARRAAHALSGAAHGRSACASAQLRPNPPPRPPRRASRQAGAFFYVLGVLYILLGMSIICEDYFVASLAALGNKFGLSDDVNGARSGHAPAAAPARGAQCGARSARRCGHALRTRAARRRCAAPAPRGAHAARVPQTTRRHAHGGWLVAA
jgi:hypothetical protein